MIWDPFVCWWMLYWFQQFILNYQFYCGNPLWCLMYVIQTPFPFPHYLQSTYKKNYQYYCSCHCCYYHSFVIIMIHHSRIVLCWCDSFLINICLMQLHDFVPCFLLNFLQKFYDPIFVELERVMLKLIKIWVTLSILLNYGLQVIAVNGKFPGPLINSTNNDNVNVNVHNDLDENLLMTWLVSAQYNIILVFFKH